MYNSNEIEKEVLSFWEKNKIFEELLKKNKGKKKWKFIDGPITANNPMGVHHAWGRTYKDLFHRFKAMQGHEMRYQNGFDCQGLWVEREEEKELGLNNKEEIEKFGILKFVESCMKRVEKFSKIQTEESIMLGSWMDWENSYYTNTNENNLHNWFLLKSYFDKGWLYKGHDVVPWCCRCGTASSKHDIVTEGYKDVFHDALFMKFPLKKRKNEYLLIFTTTPWTVPANVAVAANEKSLYVKFEKEGNSYWIAKKRFSDLKEREGYKILEEKKGKNLEGIEYEMPYKNLSKQKDVLHKVVLWELASEEEGTGFVHVAPGCGSEDCNLGKKLNLPAIAPLDSNGDYQDGYENFSNKKYGEVNKEVLRDLKERGFVYKIEKIKHRYPHCWRCGEELVFRLVDEWYISSREIKKKLIDENKKIVWYPKYGKIRQEDWFNNMGDWLISRKRYYGLPLPIWECSCGEIEVIGSLDELKKKAIDKTKVEKLSRIHRPWVDEIKIKCKKCGKEVSRVPDVGDAWLDAGIVPFSTLNYLTNEKHWKNWFPADLISENMPGQYRGWFNALMWASITIAGKAPFKSIFGYETLKDEKGEEMHKSKGNAIWFRDAVEKIGADTMRLLYCSQDPSQELRFGFNVAREPRNRLNIFYNLRKIVTSCVLSKKLKELNIEDKWILSRLNSLILYVTQELEQFHPHNATRALQNFWLNDFSRGYVQIVRDRISREEESVGFVLAEVYTNLVKLCAPFIPFITEAIWQDLLKKEVVKEKSVHLSSWPIPKEKDIDKKIEENFEVAFLVIEKGLAERDKTKIGLKWPLQKAILYTPKKLEKYTLEVILSQLNIKELEIKSSEDLKVKLDTSITPELESEGYAREVSRKVQDFRKSLGLEKKDKIDLYLILEREFKDILNKNLEFLKERTNSKNIEIFEAGKHPDKLKEKFKNKIGFSIKGKKGEIVIITGG